MTIVCIHCGAPVNELYRAYSPTVLKLSTCSCCDRIADHYVEYEPGLIMLDLLLLRLPAYRHVCSNAVVNKNWKYFCMFVACRAYFELVFSSEVQDYPSNSEDLLLTFYRHVLVCLLGSLTSLSVAVLLANYLSASMLSLVEQFRFLSLGLYGYVILLFAVVWEQHTNLALILLINAFIFVSFVQTVRAYVTSFGEPDVRLRRPTVKSIHLCWHSLCKRIDCSAEVLEWPYLIIYFNLHCHPPAHKVVCSRIAQFRWVFRVRHYILCPPCER